MLPAGSTPSKLVYDGVPSARNEILINLQNDIPRYNFLFQTGLNQYRSSPDQGLDGRLVGLLDSIFKNAIAYLLLRPPPSRGRKGTSRTEAICSLIKQIESHAEYFQIKFLAFSDQKGGANYWLERSAQNLYGPEVYEDFLEWIATTEKQSFVKRHAETKSDLQYFTELQKTKYEVEFVNREARYVGGDPITTSGGIGGYSGLDDSYIYVCSARTRKIYTAESIAGQIHHSSFLSGEPVIAGGDWIVRNGQVVFINAASGHYRPSAGNMQMFLRLYSSQLNPNAWVQPTYKGPVYKIRDYMLAGDSAKVDPKGMELAHWKGPTVNMYEPTAQNGAPAPASGRPLSLPKNNGYVT